ncbi:MAG: DUF362 domain-containing protein [Myxococcales bacterium]|nr:DUF362 domain-containing protein [Myxococcales bacterium]
MPPPPKKPATEPPPEPPELPESRPNSAPGLESYRREQRRRFLKGALASSGLALGAGWAALAPPGFPLSLRDPTGELGKPRPSSLRLPEGGYAVAPRLGAADLGIAHGSQLMPMLRAAIDAIGGIQHFIQRGDVVLLKPNVAFERAAALGATSDPELLGALVALCREAGAAEVRVADNPIESPEACFARSGLQRAAVEAGARLFLPQHADFRELLTPGAALIERWPFFARPFSGVTKVIGLAPVKDHNLCRASMTTKNWYGLLGGRRNQFHQDIHGIIADLALMLRPSFVVLDGRRVLHRSGPTGGSLSDVKAGHTLVAATDSLAADAYGWSELLERRDEPLPRYFALCAERHLGQPDYRALRLAEVRLG